MASSYREKGEEEAKLDTTTFMVSALHHDGIADVRDYLLEIASNKPWVLPRAPRLFFASPSEAHADSGISEEVGNLKNIVLKGAIYPAISSPYHIHGRT